VFFTKEEYMAAKNMADKLLVSLDCNCINAGFTPMAMLYRDKTGERDPAWVRFAWPWVRPAAIYAKKKMKEDTK
jgi:hypothetical protein